MRYLQPHTGGKQNRLFIIFLSFCFIIFNQSGLPEPVRIQPEPHGSSPEPANDKNTKKKIKTRGFLHFLYFCFMFQSGSRFIIFSIFVYHLFIVSLSFFHHFPTFVLFFGKFVDHFPARVSFSQPRIKPEPRGSSPEPANDEKKDKK